MLAVGETDCVPDVAFVPDQPPDAVQLDTLLEDHERVEEPPATIDVGEAERDTDGLEGGGGGVPPPFSAY